MFSIGFESTPEKVQQVPYFPMLRERNARKGFLEVGGRPRIVVPRFAGMRLSAGGMKLLSLRVRKIDLEHRVMRLEPGTTKNDEGRGHP